MSIASEISRLTTLRTAILSAIQSKGVAVSDSAVLEDCPGYIESIPESGNSRTGMATVTTSANVTEIAFEGLVGTPKRYTVTAMSAVNSITSSSGFFSTTYRPCAIALFYDGETLSGHYTTSSSYSRTNQYSDSACDQVFENGILTLTLNGAYFPSGHTYTIFYEF